MIRPPVKNENSQRFPDRHKNDGLRNTSRTTDDPLIVGSGRSGRSDFSDLDMIGHHINHENPQLLPYPSSSTLHSNGGLCNTSFMTSPSNSSFTEVPNCIAEVCLPRCDRSL